MERKKERNDGSSEEFEGLLPFSSSFLSFSIRSGRAKKRKKEKEKEKKCKRRREIVSKGRRYAQVNARARVRRGGRSSGAREDGETVDGKHANGDEWEREKETEGGGQAVERRAIVCETRMEGRGGIRSTELTA